MVMLSENSRQGFKIQNPACIGLDSNLSRMSRWGCGHVYDETPVGIVVYVRNDPVNYVDRDGRVADPVYTDDNGNPFPINGTWVGAGFDPWMIQLYVWQTPWETYLDMVAGGLIDAGTFMPTAEGGSGADTVNPDPYRMGVNGFNMAWAAVGNADCAKALGFDTSDFARGFLNSVAFDTSPLAFNANFNSSNGTYEISFQAGAFDPATGITFNLQLGSNVNHYFVGTMEGGTPIYANLASGWESDLGLKAGSLTNDNFWAVVWLHESGHGTGTLASDVGNSGLSRENNQKVVDNCFKGLK